MFFGCQYGTDRGWIAFDGKGWVCWVEGLFQGIKPHPFGTSLLFDCRGTDIHNSYITETALLHPPDKHIRRRNMPYVPHSGIAVLRYKLAAAVIFYYQCLKNQFAAGTA